MEVQSSIITVVTDSQLTYQLTRQTGKTEYFEDVSELDPMTHVHKLRMHLFHGMGDNLVLLEKAKLLDHLKYVVDAYDGLLSIVSTPLPFALLQMGRTFHRYDNRQFLRAIANGGHVPALAFGELRGPHVPAAGR